MAFNRLHSIRAATRFPADPYAARAVAEDEIEQCRALQRIIDDLPPSGPVVMFHPDLLHRVRAAADVLYSGKRSGR